MRLANSPRKARSLFLVLALACAATIPSHAEEPTKPFELQQHRAEIREALLKETPLGASEKEVLAVISKRLVADVKKLPAIENQPATGPSAEASQRRGVRSLRLFLGQYYDHPELVFLAAPMLTQKEVTAQWAFDQQGRLIEIFVDKLASIY